VFCIVMLDDMENQIYKKTRRELDVDIFLSKAEKKKKLEFLTSIWDSIFSKKSVSIFGNKDAIFSNK